MKAEDVAEFMLQAAREFMPADERRDPDAEALARELLADEMGPVIMRMCILAHNAGVKRGLELAKEHAEARSFIDGTRADIDWSAADEAVAKEGK